MLISAVNLKDKLTEIKRLHLLKIIMIERIKKLLH
jgi:hypothetical protein